MILFIPYSLGRTDHNLEVNDCDSWATVWHLSTANKQVHTKCTIVHALSGRRFSIVHH